MLENSHLYQEIHEQPDVLAQVFQHERTAADHLAAEIRRRDIDHVVIAARGTSDNAARYAQYLLGSVNKLPVGLATPSLFSIYNQPPKFGNALVIGISQSGKSPDIVSVLAEARRQGALTTAITNIADSDLGQQADHVLQLHAGVEQSVAATKTYTSELAAIALLSTRLADDAEMDAALLKIPDLVSQTLALSDGIGAVAERYCFMLACIVIGRGYNYATAFELALKMKELTYTIVAPYSSADFLHGPMALVESRFPVVVVAPSGIMLPEIKQFMGTLLEREAELIVISDGSDALGFARTPLQLPSGIPEWLSPMASIIPGQLLSMHLADVRDYDVDKPRGLRKVTETL
ncbi:MAG: SIS domain-containing protein [Proteobacteria bacterium]|nr:SIS domain-containing protein [Pseudomonadota bacterium]